MTRRDGAQVCGLTLFSVAGDHLDPWLPWPTRPISLFMPPEACHMFPGCSVEEQVLNPMRANPRILSCTVFNLGSSVHSILACGSHSVDPLPSPSSQVILLLAEKAESDKPGLNPSSGSHGCALGHLTLGL